MNGVNNFMLIVYGNRNMIKSGVSLYVFAYVLFYPAFGRGFVLSKVK